MLSGSIHAASIVIERKRNCKSEPCKSRIPSQASYLTVHSSLSLSISVVKGDNREYKIKTPWLLFVCRRECVIGRWVCPAFLDCFLSPSWPDPLAPGLWLQITVYYVFFPLGLGKTSRIMWRMHIKNQFRQDSYLSQTEYRIMEGALIYLSSSISYADNVLEDCLGYLI